MFRFTAGGSCLVHNIVIERGLQGPWVHAQWAVHACTEVRPPDPAHVLSELGAYLKQIFAKTIIHPLHQMQMCLLQ